MNGTARLLFVNFSKVAGAKPGFVIFTNQRTLYVTPREGLEKFLSAET